MTATKLDSLRVIQMCALQQSTFKGCLMLEIINSVDIPQFKKYGTKEIKCKILYINIKQHITEAVN